MLQFNTLAGGDSLRISPCGIGLPLKQMLWARVVQPYCKQGPDNFSDCLRGPDVLNLLVFHIHDSNF